MPDVTSRLNEALTGRYAVERRLGEGGMATVYLARDLRHDRTVALKVLKPELAAVVGAERFLAEIKTTANLQHPHILPLFDSGQADGMLYYVMPHVEGESLRERLDREHQLAVDDAVEIATDVAEALEYAHSRGVIHRDIKPANILLQAGKPVVSDFGIALAVSAGGGGRLTETGLSLGTPHYMSPEQATGDMQVGPATDVYALGCVLYEMLVGEPPYTGSTPQAILGKIIAGEGVSATKQRATVPANVDAAIRKALEKVPADRFASAGELARALGNAAFRHGPTAGAPLAVGNPRGRAAALALAGAVFGALLMALFTGRERIESPSGVRRFSLLEAGSVLRRGPLQPDLAIAPDGRTVAYVGNSADGTRSQLYLRPIDEMASIALVGSEGAESPSFSPDGRWIAFVDGTEQATLKRVAVTGGAAETLAVLEAVGYIAGVTWEDSERLIVGTGSGTGLFRVTVGGAVELLAQGQYHWPDYVEGRDAVVFMDHDSSQLHLAALDLSTGEVSPLGVVGTAPRYLASGHLVYTAPDGRLAAARFDERALALVGDPVTLPEIVDLKTSNEWAANFDTSSEGTLVFVPGGSGAVGGVQLLRVERDGTGSPAAFIEGDVAYPRVSPDGSRLAVAIGIDLWVIDLLRGARTRVTFSGSNRFQPLWTTDGSRLTHADGADAQNRVLLTAADGSGRQDTLIALGPRTFPTSWSPDGRTLALTSGPAGGPRDIHLLVNDGARPDVAPFIATGFSERGAVFSPDGRSIAYVSDKSGRAEIYVRPTAGSGAEVTVSLEGGGEPVWSRSGGELFYRGSSAFFVVSISSSASGVIVGQPGRLFTDTYRTDNSGILAYANYDVLPSGELLVVTDPESPSSGGIHIAIDWMSELRERLPD